MISGTSMDGVDVALLDTDGVQGITRGPALGRPYTPAERAAIVAAMADAMAAPDAAHRTEALLEAERVVTKTHGDAIDALLTRERIEPDIIGWHGQTLAHAPERGFTMQIGDAAALAGRFGVPVVSQFRLADVAAGGEGAPLVPAYHRALAATAGLEEPVLVINLGGVANLTYIEGDILIAFDTGPASALIDDEMATVGERFDAGGATAARGRVNQHALRALLDHPYFAAPAPKSLDRDAFSAAPTAHLPFADKIATLTHFSAAALASGVRQLPKWPARAIAAGGGTHNRTLMGFIEAELGIPVQSADNAGFSADFMEAEAFAYLAVRSVQALPITFPGTTGVPVPLTGGRLTEPGPTATK
ncbi:MAG: anhydro-N-acetylmuramic acid kinase, partial [Pseudomonadota bacterium]